MWRRRDRDPGPSPARDYSLALAEARRNLDSQLGLVDASRARVTGLLGVGGLVGTFVGGLGAIQKDGSLTVALVVAAVAFGVAVVAGLLILTPWKFSGPMKPSDLVTWGDQGMSRPNQERDLALHIEVEVANNRGKARWIQRGLVVVALAVAVEFVALAYQLVRST